MKITRRGFLKLSGAATGFLITSSVFDWVKIPEALADIGAKVGTETTSICYGCACGCGMIVTTKNSGLPNEKLIDVEGDPTSPVNEGALCSKCLASKDTVNRRVPDGLLTSTYFEGATFKVWDPHKFNTDGSIKVGKNRRIARVLYRAPGSTTWEVKTWTWALQAIAQKVAATHGPPGNGFEEFDGMFVNRVNNIACLGGAAHDNQECYLLRKLMTGLGVYYVEHQARI